MTGNDFIKFMLRTPLRFFLGSTMLITVTGRKTGRQYSTPVNYYREGPCLWVLSSRDRTWWRNVRNGARVSLLLNGRTLEAVAEAELEETAVVSRLTQYVRRIPMAARSLGIRLEDDRVPNTEDILRVAGDRLFVRIRPV